ncbi:polyphosphate kinase 1 [Pseudoflavonifractor phocaeensis]|uniref:polyphosphate kinase 1 n=1 Tax=Pseudoflavonifractor phocaeensis TaxID=1870988 RepID=UPI00195ABEDF|nr:polyphosphate kinase 1 [Pseudoflavonifractor phocaeensis]MBM6724427.1 polyphosphate kinase 1 [Pseudoflavonifractor phocaeensis]
MSKEVDTRYTQERELSWLRFNERVLEEAKDERVPLFERLKFAAIFTSNLDEFFMIRVGSITDMTLSKQTHVDSKSGLTPSQQLQAIFKTVPGLYKQRDKILSQLEKRLRTCNICNLAPSELDGKERKLVERWFRDYVQPVLSPMVVDSHHPFPHLPSNSLAIALSLRMGTERCFGLVPIPRNLPPYIQLEERGLRYLLTEQVVLAYADTLFENYQVEEKCVVSVTRNADISPEDEDYDVGEDFRAHMQKVLKKRARLAPVRLEIQGGASPELQQYLCQRLNLTDVQVFHAKGPLNMGYVYSLENKLPQESAAALCYPPYTPQWPAGLAKGEKLIPQVLRRDALLFYPYQSMEPFLQLVREAANDPAVLSIKITIYRLASTAKLVEYLAAAAENGKDVTVLMELRARFDEQNNIAWAQRLEEAGCTILYGFEGYKVHSKICLITRREKGRIQYITQIGTGNYNEKTAKLYTDFCLMTASPAIGADGAVFFQNMATSNLNGEYHQLLVAPHGLKNRLLDLMDGEIEKARQGKPARIFVKVNSVTDRELIDKLSQASQAGVPVTMNVRGICCLRPGVPGLTDHIKVFSIVGRYLEHPRIYAFGVGEETRIYIGSADLMTRNTERRVEIACPVLDPAVRRQIRHYVELYCSDNEKARVLQPDGSYTRVERPEGAPGVDAQAALMDEAEREALAAAQAPPAPERRSGLLSRLFGRRKE